jgi:serine/threonine protein kinase
MRCAACQVEVAKLGPFCPECAAPLVPDGDATENIAMRRKPPSSNASGEDGRFQPGTLLGERYRIIAIVGREARARSTEPQIQKLGRDLAIKIIPAAFAQDTDRMARFQREAEVLASLNHPTSPKLRKGRIT